MNSGVRAPEEMKRSISVVDLRSGGRCRLHALGYELDGLPLRDQEPSRPGGEEVPAPRHQAAQRRICIRRDAGDNMLVFCKWKLLQLRSGGRGHVEGANSTAAATAPLTSDR